jgi:hypothetical protein
LCISRWPGRGSPIGAAELQRQLVAGVERAAAGEIAAEQRVLAGADDVFVGRVVAAAAEDGALHGGDDVALEGAGAGEAMGLVEGEVGEFCRLADVGEFGRALDDA